MALSAPRLFWHFLHSPRWWCGLLLTVGSGIGLAVLYGTLTTTAEDRAFAARGVRTGAEITLRSEANEWEDAGGRPEMRTDYRVHYRFHDDAGNEQMGVAVVPKSTWLRYQAGDTLAIEYLPDQPDRSRALERLRPPLGMAVGVAFGSGLFLLLGGLVLVGSAWSRARRRWRVVRNGIPCLGRVTEVLTAPNPNGHEAHAGKPSGYHLGYTFQDSRGVHHDGQTAGLPPEVAFHWKPGDPILVLYAPPDIFRHEVDLFGARADDLQTLLNRSVP
jgi:hypothetical protein